MKRIISTILFLGILGLALAQPGTNREVRRSLKVIEASLGAINENKSLFNSKCLCELLKYDKNTGLFLANCEDALKCDPMVLLHLRRIAFHLNQVAQSFNYSRPNKNLHKRVAEEYSRLKGNCNGSEKEPENRTKKSN